MLDIPNECQELLNRLICLVITIALPTIFLFCKYKIHSVCMYDLSALLGVILRVSSTSSAKDLVRLAIVVLLAEPYSRIMFAN